MPTKVGNGGNGQENYDPNTGKYISNGFVSGLKKGFNIKSNVLDVIPKNNRIFCKDLNVEQKIDLYNKWNININNNNKLKFNTARINTPGRQQLRKNAIMSEIKRQLLGKVKGKTATYVIGIPGSGKSTISKEIIQSGGAFECDSDLMKEYLPEFQQDNSNISAVQEESTGLANEMARTLSNNDYNLLFGKIGRNVGSTLKQMQYLKDKGYTINTIMVDLPLEKALERNKSRYVNKETKRFVPPSVLFGADEHIFNFFNVIVDSGMVSNYKVYSNDVKKGEKPKLLYEF